MRTKLLYLTLSSILYTSSILGGESTPMQQSSLIADNQLQIDDRTTQSVNAAFARDGKTANSGVSVTTENGVVTLSGSVIDSKLKSALENKARNASGVKKVVNTIEVKSTATKK